MTATATMPVLAHSQIGNAMLGNPLVVQKVDFVARSPLKQSASDSRLHRTTGTMGFVGALSAQRPPTPVRSLAPQQPYFNTRAAEILVPAWGPVNDTNRIRNIGKPLQPRVCLTRTGSAPTLAEEKSSASSAPSSPVLLDARARASAQVTIGYPDFNPLSLEGKPRRKSPWQPLQKPKLVMRAKEMTWEDLPPPEMEVAGSIFTSASPQGSPSTALRRTFRLMQGLRNLRRLAAGNAEGAPGPQDGEGEGAGEGEALGAAGAAASAAPADPPPGHDDDLLHATLRELSDTAEALATTVEQMAASQQVIAVTGGARHATCVISQRALHVIKRKLELLLDVEGRAMRMKALQAQRDEIVHQITSGNFDLPPDFINVRKYISSKVHRPGEPVDADRSNFEMFCSTFKLPSRHQALERLRQLSADFSDWWAHATLSEATAGADYATITCMTLLAVAVGAPDDHPMLLRAKILLRDRAADKVLKEAKEAQARDVLAAEKAVQRGDTPVIGQASKAADALEKSILQAEGEGVPTSDQRMQEAVSIMKGLREADGQRKRMANRQKRS